MSEVIELHNYICEKYGNHYSSISCNHNMIQIVFHAEFSMTIVLERFCMIYFNDIFYYDIDYQDIVDAIDDFMSNHYIFCETKKRRKSVVKIVPIENYREDPHIIRAWSIFKTVKQIDVVYQNIELLYNALIRMSSQQLQEVK